jgi:hypothetical protein
MNENETIILTPVYDEENAPYIYPDADDLQSYQRLQFIVWGLESLEKQLWNSAERGWHDTTGPEFQSFLKMIRGLYEDKTNSLIKYNHEILHDEMLEQASQMF